MGALIHRKRCVRPDAGLAVCRRRFAPIGGKIGDTPQKGERTTDTLFSEVKERLNLIDTARYYGIQPNRSGFVNCLFHKEKTPSLKLYPAHFHCYGCGKHGDIIALTTQLFALPPYQAAQKLAEDFHISQGSKYKNLKPRISEQMKYYEQEQRTYEVLNRYCRFLEKWREDYRPATPDEDFHPLFVESLMKYEQYNYYRDIFITGMEDERREFMKTFGKEITAIEERLPRTIKTQRSVSHER